MKSTRAIVLLVLLAVAPSATAQEKSDKFAVFVTRLGGCCASCPVSD